MKLQPITSKANWEVPEAFCNQANAWLAEHELRSMRSDEIVDEFARLSDEDLETLLAEHTMGRAEGWLRP